MSAGKLCDIGERMAIQNIRKLIGSKHIGDDCAAIPMGGSYLLVTTDMAIQGVHAGKWMKPYDIGHFLVAVNLSDIAAMGGEPLGFVAALGLPRDYPRADFRMLVKGLRDCAKKYGTELVGGDTKESMGITLAGTAFGAVEKNKILRRSGARPGDIVAVTGEMGTAAAAYLAGKNNIKSVSMQPLCRPAPRLALGRALALCGAATAMQDISDGLAVTAHQIAQESRAGMEIDWDRVPVSRAAKTVAEKTGLPVRELALFFGGEYELVVTVKKGKFSAARRAVEKAGGTLAEIGRVVPGRKLTLSTKGRKEPLPYRGWEHFSTGGG